MSSASPNPGETETTTDGNNPNPNTANMGGRLTEKEKKQNHIASGMLSIWLGGFLVFLLFLLFPWDS